MNLVSIFAVENQQGMHTGFNKCQSVVERLAVVIFSAMIQAILETAPQHRSPFQGLTISILMRLCLVGPERAV
jgi:hypothetical protein